MFKIKVDRNDNQDDANTLCLDEDDVKMMFIPG